MEFSFARRGEVENSSLDPPPPPSWGLMESILWGEIPAKILRMKIVTGKILETKELPGESRHFLI
jgi:hypothetical protein